MKRWSFLIKTPKLKIRKSSILRSLFNFICNQIIKVSNKPMVRYKTICEWVTFLVKIRSLPNSTRTSRRTKTTRKRVMEAWTLRCRIVAPRIYRVARENRKRDTGLSKK